MEFILENPGEIKEFIKLVLYFLALAGAFYKAYEADGIIGVLMQAGQEAGTEKFKKKTVELKHNKLTGLARGAFKRKLARIRGRKESGDREAKMLKKWDKADRARRALVGIRRNTNFIHPPTSPPPAPPPTDESGD